MTTLRQLIATEFPDGVYSGGRDDMKEPDIDEDFFAALDEALNTVDAGNVTDTDFSGTDYHPFSAQSRRSTRDRERSSILRDRVKRGGDDASDDEINLLDAVVIVGIETDNVNRKDTTDISLSDAIVGSGSGSHRHSHRRAAPNALFVADHRDHSIRAQSIDRSSSALWDTGPTLGDDTNDSSGDDSSDDVDTATGAGDDSDDNEHSDEHHEHAGISGIYAGRAEDDEDEVLDPKYGGDSDNEDISGPDLRSLFGIKS
jgi:hypothetical protein